MPGLRRVAAAALVAGLAAGLVLVIGRLGFGDQPGWPLVLGLFCLLLGAQLTGPGPHHGRPSTPPLPARWDDGQRQQVSSPR